jgi:hypothetical protein
VKGTFNAVIIATMHNTVYVYDADKENRGPQGRTTPLWATWLGPPRPGGKDIDMWSTNDLYQKLGTSEYHHSPAPYIQPQTSESKYPLMRASELAKLATFGPGLK